LTAFWRAFGDEDGPAAASAWPAFRDAFAALDSHAHRWSETLAALPELTAGLVEFSRNRL
jgi:hypothetical protein